MKKNNVHCYYFRQIYEKIYSADLIISFATIIRLQSERYHNTSWMGSGGNVPIMDSECKSYFVIRNLEADPFKSILWLTLRLLKKGIPIKPNAKNPTSVITDQLLKIL